MPVEITDAAAVALTPELKGRWRRKAPPVVVVPIPNSPSRVTDTSPTPKSQTSLWALLLTSIGAAIAMLFTPCVFPMIPITVSFFLKQSEKEHHKPFVTAGVYSLHHHRGAGPGACWCWAS